MALPAGLKRQSVTASSNGRPAISKEWRRLTRNAEDILFQVFNSSFGKPDMKAVNL